MNTSTELDINSVRAFWDEKPCQADLSQAEDRRRYFEEISQRRYGRREEGYSRLDHPVAKEAFYGGE